MMKEVKEKGRRKRCKASKGIRRMKKNVREEQNMLREDSQEPKKQPKKSSSASSQATAKKKGSKPSNGSKMDMV